MARKDISRVLSGGVIAFCILLLGTPHISAQSFTARKLTFTVSGSVGLGGVVMNGLPGNPVTDANGYYSITVDYDWSGKVTPTKPGYTFKPDSRPYTHVTSNQANQDYVATPITFTISGTTGMEGVLINGLPGNPVTDANGAYSASVPYGFNGTATPTKPGYMFTPPERKYGNVINDQMSQDYTPARITFLISGTAGTDGVVMDGLPGNPVTDTNGNYSARVQFGWTGTVTPTKRGYTFVPPSRQYTDLVMVQANQDYAAALIKLTISGSAGVGGVVMNGLPGNPVADANGHYSAEVEYNWTGRVTPSKPGYTFDPPNKSFTNVTSDLGNQSFSATPIKLTISGSTGVAGVTMNGLPGNPVTGEGGLYSVTVDYGFGGTVMPQKEGYAFTPAQKRYDPVTADQLNQNYTGVLLTFTISGTVGVDGVMMKGLPGDPVTSGGGNYSASIAYGWKGTVIPTKEGYAFNPPNRPYSDVASAQPNQNYVGTVLKRSISGTISSDKGPIEGVLVSADGGGGSATTDTGGQYQLLVNYGWKGTVRPTSTGYTFKPPSKKYDPVRVDQTYQAYVAELMRFTISGSVVIGGTAIEGVLISASGDGTSATTDAEGKYSITVPYGWSGTVTPTKPGYVFDPPGKEYVNVTTNIKDGVPVPPRQPTTPTVPTTPTRIVPTTPTVPTTPDVGPGPPQFDTETQLMQQQIAELQKRVKDLLGQISGEKPPVTEPNLPYIPTAPGEVKGPPISAVFLNTDLRQALQEIASQAGIKIYADNTVKGMVTCRLVEVPLERALQTVLTGTPYAFKEIPDSYLVYTPISNTFFDTDLRQALQDIATDAGVVIIPDESVTGLVTAQLEEVSLDTALDMVLAGTGYVVKKTPYYYLVCSADPTQAAFPAVSETRCMRMSYLRGDEAAALVSSAFQNYIKADPNTICVTAPTTLMNRIVADLKQIDRPPRHVMLDARIVVMERGDLLNLGIEWGWPTIRAGVFGSDHRMGGEPESQFHGQWPWGVQIGYTPDATFTDSLLLTLNLLAENEEAKVLASPQVLAQDGKRAQIRVMREEYYMMTAPTYMYMYSRAELEKIESGTVLTITPRIGDNNDITLELSVELSDSIPSARVSDLPLVTRRTANNTVRVKDGGTVALAGLTESKTRIQERRVPGLSDIPLFGMLFRSNDTDKVSREVAVFVTAYLMPETGQTVQFAPSPAVQPQIGPLGEQFDMSLRDSLLRQDAEQPAIGPASDEAFRMRLRESLSRSIR